MSIRKTGGGRFEPNKADVYFLAIWPQMHLQYLSSIGEGHDHVLCATNDLKEEVAVQAFENIIQHPRVKPMLDSGVFNLSTGHAKKHGISMDEALSLAPAQVDGFEKLFQTYVSLIKRFESKLWGYVEMDQGGRANKIKTRARLEKMGLRPIPVFHPVNDGWDYFDYLATRYDRICVGNLVNASPSLRTQLLYEIHRRWQNYPHLWIHALGVSPNHHVNTYRFSSCDSSSWMSSMRWGDPNPAYTLGERVRALPKWLCPPIGGGRPIYSKATDVCATQVLLFDQSRRTHFQQLDHLLH